MCLAVHTHVFTQLHIHTSELHSTASLCVVVVVVALQQQLGGLSALLKDSSVIDDGCDSFAICEAPSENFTTSVSGQIWVRWKPGGRNVCHSVKHPLILFPSSGAADARLRARQRRRRRGPAQRRREVGWRRQERQDVHQLELHLRHLLHRRAGGGKHTHTATCDMIAH